MSGDDECFDGIGKQEFYPQMPQIFADKKSAFIGEICGRIYGTLAENFFPSRLHKIWMTCRPE